MNYENQIQSYMRLKLWTAEEDAYMLANYPSMVSVDVAKYLDRPLCSIYGRAKNLKISKSEEFRKSELSGRLTEKNINKATQFKPGHVPANKGKKHTAEIKAKMRHTFFQKGNVPHNAKPEVNETFRESSGYWYTRLENGKWYPKHQKIWQDANGPTPKGYLVIFKDGDKNNCCLENLALLSMKENALRNRGSQWPLEIQEIIRLKNKIIKKINEKQTERP